jgi:hypothetical protein
MGFTDNERKAWINRPASEMYLGLAEWLDVKRGVGKPAESAAVISNAPLQFTQEAVGRVRHASGVMNGLEKRYAAHLELRKTVGEILIYRFEPIKFRLAPSTYYSPDFVVMMPNGSFECHETKGTIKDKSTGRSKPHYEDDSIIKVKMAADIFTEFTFRMTWFEKGVGWKFRDFGSK